jgi:hypothetical protein
MAVILVRLAHLLGQSGSLPSELAADTAMNNRGIQYLATLLDVHTTA